VREVVRFLRQDAVFVRARIRHHRKLAIHDWLTETQQMLPVAAAGNWDIPPIESAGGLADWLELTPGELDWFADLKGLGCRGKANLSLGHYRYHLREKGEGGIRLIEAPKPRLKQLQRRILTGILDHIPLHEAVHGFRKGRSIKSFVAPHTGRRVVLRMDLQDFFPSISGARVQALLRTAGYPESVSDLLGGICSHATPLDVWQRVPFPIGPRALWQARMFYRRPHLPQGAPTSPGIANLCAYRVDCRLAGLAHAAGASYTRYADDLAFSGDEDFERQVQRFAAHAALIVHEEGFNVHHRKTRIMRQGVRQHLAGLVANQSANIIRADYDRLKAILTNCVRHGAESQNREGHASFRAHLEGRVGFVEMINPRRGEKLRAILNRIQWG
jgi:hypothetical protein